MDVSSINDGVGVTNSDMVVNGNNVNALVLVTNRSMFADVSSTNEIVTVDLVTSLCTLYA